MYRCLKAFPCTQGYPPSASAPAYRPLCEAIDETRAACCCWLNRVSENAFGASRGAAVGRGRPPTGMLHVQVPTKVLTAMRGCSWASVGAVLLWHRVTRQCSTVQYCAQTGNQHPPGSRQPVMLTDSSPGSSLCGYPPGSRGLAGSRLVWPRYHMLCTRSEMMGSPDKSLHFGMRAGGGTVQPGSAISPNHTPGITVQPNAKAGKPF